LKFLYLKAILDYVDVHNEEGKPFVWTKSADEILDKIRDFGRRTLQVHAEDGDSPVIHDPGH
jgi:hypothetical protein